MEERIKILVGKLMAENIPFIINKEVYNIITSIHLVKIGKGASYTWAFSDMVFGTIDRKDYIDMDKISDDEILKEIKIMEEKDK